MTLLRQATRPALPMGSTARRSSGSWTVEVTATSAHSSGIFTQSSGYGAIYELARILDGFRRELREDKLTYNVGLIGGGTSAALDAGRIRLEATGKTNIIPPTAVARGDLRAIDPGQIERTQEKMLTIVAQSLPGTKATISFDDDGYPPMLLDDEAVALPFQPSAARLLRLREVALAVVRLDIELAGSHHSAKRLCPFTRWRLFRFLPGCRALGGGFLRRSLFPLGAGLRLSLTQAFLERCHAPAQERYIGIETSDLVIDLAVLAALLGIALRSDRFWPLWVAGLQLTVTVSHVMKAIKPDLMPFAYAAAERFWSYPILLILFAGAWRQQRRRRERLRPAAT